MASQKDFIGVWSKFCVVTVHPSKLNGVHYLVNVNFLSIIRFKILIIKFLFKLFLDFHQRCQLIYTYPWSLSLLRKLLLRVLKLPARYCWPRRKLPAEWKRTQIALGVIPSWLLGRRCGFLPATCHCWRELRSWQANSVVRSVLKLK